MGTHLNNRGSALLITVFVIAMLTAVVSGILQVNTEEIQLMQNQIDAAEAEAIARAGLNDAFAELRSDSQWRSGFTDKAFGGGSYTVTVSGSGQDLTVVSTATTAKGFVCRIRADITLSSSSPYTIRVNNLRINE